MKKLLVTLGIAAVCASAQVRAQTTPPVNTNTPAFSNPVSQLFYNFSVSLGTNAPAMGTETFDFNLATMTRSLDSVESTLELHWNYSPSFYVGGDLGNGAAPGVVTSVHGEFGAQKALSGQFKVQGGLWGGRYTGSPGQQPEWEGGGLVRGIWAPTGSVGFGAEARVAANSVRPDLLGEYLGVLVNLRF
jgi:hypothetical protein